MKNYTLIFFLFLSFVLVHSQNVAAQSNTFSKTFGGFANDEGHDIVQLQDGGFLITGANGSLGDTTFDAYLLKINSTGQDLWEKSLGGNFQDGGNEFAAAAEGKFFVAEHTESYGLGDCEAWFFAIDSIGDTLWTRTYGTPGDDAAYGAVVGTDGNYYAVGLVNNWANDGDAFITKITPQGAVLWTKTFGGVGEDYFTQIRQTDDGNFALAGKKCVNGLANFWLMKVDTAGILVWDKNYGIGNNEIAYGLRNSIDGGFILVGSSQNYTDSSMSLYFVRTDVNGDTVWTKTILNSIGCAANSVVLATDSNWVICADAYNSMSNSFDACLIKMNDSGQEVWTKYFGGTSADNARRLTQCSNGDFAFTGYTKSSGAGLEDVFIVRVNSNGDFVTSVHELFSANSISVHPNPFTEKASMQFSPGLKNGIITINDMQGKTVKTITNLESGSVEIEKNNLSKGIYFVNLLDANTVIQTKKIVIE